MGNFNLSVLVIFICHTLCLNSVQGEHIVFMHTVSSYSHRVPQWPLIEALLAKGHNVTFISGYAGKEMSHPNVTDVIPHQLSEFMEFTLRNFDINHRIYGILPKAILVYELLSYLTCKDLYTSEEFKNWLNSTSKVDLILTDICPECAYGLAKKLNAKYGTFQTVPLMGKTSEMFGFSPESSTIPDFDIALKTPFSFLKRVIGVILPLLWRGHQIIYYNLLYKSLFAHYLGLDSGTNLDLYEMEANTSLFMLNGDYLEDYPRSYPPFVVKIPAIHIKDMENVTLDQKIEEFIMGKDSKGNAGKGTIYISFGTVANAPSLPEYFRKIFFNSIALFPELRFIWRWKGQFPDKYPQNLMLVPWVNQQKLLAHKATKGFITQAGRPSIQESFYHGVPTITFPILADQDFNSHRVELLGVSINLDIATVTEQQLTDAIRKVVDDPKIQERAKMLAKLGRDVPINSVEVALWWTEFVLRHSVEELNLLKPTGMQQYWFQRRELDVWAFLLICLVAFSIGSFYFMRIIIRRMFRNKTDKLKGNVVFQNGDKVKHD